MYGSPTTKELKNKHSARPIGGQRQAAKWRGLTARRQLVDLVRWQLQTGQSYISVQINWEEQLGSNTDCSTQGPRTYTSPPTREAAPEGPNLIVGSGGSDLKSFREWSKCHCFFSAPPPPTALQSSNQHYPTLLKT